MTEKDPNQLERLIRNVDEALAQNPALTLNAIRGRKALACPTSRILSIRADQGSGAV